MIVTKTPLRISLLGGGSDFEDYYKEYGGAVLSTAIEKSVYVIVKERFDDKIYINYSKKEIVDRVDDIKHDLVRGAMELTGVEKGIEITTLSDIPSEGSGLGSSSSITVALLHALYAYRGVLVTAEELARQACQIEVEMMGKPIGRQDQYISAFGGMRFITFSDKGIEVEDVKIDEDTKLRLEENLLLYYTGVTRKADDILVKQKANIPRNNNILEGLVRFAKAGRNLLEMGKLDEFGVLLDKGWQLKKQLAGGISNESINRIYQRALDAGAIGGKVVGAGGGGFLLLYCPNLKKDSVRAELKDLREMPFRFSQDGSKIIFDYRG